MSARRGGSRKFRFAINYKGEREEKHFYRAATLGKLGREIEELSATLRLVPFNARFVFHVCALTPFANSNVLYRHRKVHKEKRIVREEEEKTRYLRVIVR